MKVCMKVCKICGKEKELSEFHKKKDSKDGYRNLCKSCRSEKSKSYYKENKEKFEKYRESIKVERKEYDKERYKENKDIIIERVLRCREENKEEYKKKRYLYYENNKEKHNKYMKSYYKENKEKCLETKKEYRKENKEKYNEYMKSYYKENKEKYKNYSKKSYNKLKNRKKHVYAWRNILKHQLERMNTEKSGKTLDLLKYSADDLKRHLTLLFLPEMTWKNYGEWHIDHIKPVSSFHKDTPSHIVNALSNLKPMWSTTREIDGIIYEGNLNKGNKF